MENRQNTCYLERGADANSERWSEQDSTTQLGWYVLWTHSNCEVNVQKQLSAKGYNMFLAMMDKRSSGLASNHLYRVPMFSGYIFIHHAIDRYDYLDICKTKGVVSILGQRWDRLARIPDQEIETIQLAATSPQSCVPYPYLKSGDKVRITRGSLENIQGVLVKTDADKGLLVITVELLRRSVAIEIDCRYVVPA